MAEIDWGLAAKEDRLMSRAKNIVGFCFVILLVGCSPQAELDQRTRRYFEMPAAQLVNAETIRSALVSGVPLGSSVKQVQAYLERRGIGKDGLSHYYPLNEKGEIICHINLNPKTAVLTINEFGIFFVMDRDQKLKDIKVKEWHTGL